MALRASIFNVLKHLTPGGMHHTLQIMLYTYLTIRKGLDKESITARTSKKTAQVGGL